MSISLIFLLTILPHMAFAGARITLSLFALHLGATPFTVGMIISLIAVVPMVFSVRWGRRIDRSGVYKPMLLGSVLVLAGLLLAFALPRIETLFAVSVLAGTGFMLYHYSFVMPIHGSSIGLPASTIGLILGSFGSAIFVFRLILPWIVHRFDERKMIIAAMVVTGIMLSIIPLVNSVPLLMAVSFVLGIGLGGVQPMIMVKHLKKL